MRLLFVENHAIFAATVIEQFLDGHDVLVCPSLASARRAVMEHVKFDAVLVDYDLDDGKGDELVRELRREGYSGRIIAASSHEDGNKALELAGADAICAKSDMSRIASILD